MPSDFQLTCFPVSSFLRKQHMRGRMPDLFRVCEGCTVPWPEKCLAMCVRSEANMKSLRKFSVDCTLVEPQ